ncbi:MAG: outer membrane beta-barrel protein [Bacteroidota bacterium]
MITRIKSFFLLLILIVEVSLYSQSFTLGLKAGPNFTNITGYNSIVSEYRQSINVSAFAFAPISKNIDGLFELSYEQKGFNYSLQDISNSMRTEGERIYDYLTLPVGFKYNFGKKLKPYAKIGIFLAILLDAKDIATETNYAVSPPVENSWDESIMYKTETIDLGIFFGFGIQYQFSSKFILLIEGNLKSGLMLLEPDQILVEEMRHKSFLLNIGFGYILNK